MSEKFKEARTRAPNFSRQDQLLLFDVMKPYAHIIESKKTDSIKQADKQIAWIKITERFNSNAIGQPRTTETLISCYRNVKSKTKKKHSEAKILLVDPVHRGTLIKAIEEYGKNWEKVASTSSWNDPELCEEGFKELKNESQTEENKMKNFVMGTGGGPHLTDKKENVLSEIKIEPQIDGLFTIYDGDAGLTAQYQQTIPEAEQMQPIETPFRECSANSQESIIGVSKENIQESILTTPKLKWRTKILRKRKEPAFSRNETTCRKTSVNESFKQLSEAKLELVQMQKQILEREFLHKQRIQEIELEEIIKEYKYKEKMREKELEENIQENKYKKKMREKELELMDIKIDNAKNV